MKASYFTACFVSAIIGLCVSTKGMTWFEAQIECREKNQRLTLQQNKSNREYWTGVYQKKSHWIKIIGCYNDSALRYRSFEWSLSSSSPGICQELCVEKNSLLFAIQAKRCVCLSSGFNYSTNNLPSSECNNTCDNSNLLSGECGGEAAYNIYLTNKNLLPSANKSNCLSLQCGGGAKFKDDLECSQHLPSICSKIETEIAYLPWRKGMDKCKQNSTYLLGNLNLSNVASVCTSINYSDPRWIGVVREQYVFVDRGHFIADSDHPFFLLCEKCKVTKNVKCEKTSCKESLPNDVHCSESVISPPSIPDTTEIGNSTQPTNLDATKIHNESPAVKVVVPVVLVSLLSVFAVAIVIYIRRKKQTEEKDATGTHKSPTMNSECYSNIDNNISKNYFVLQKSNPSYELADHAKIESNVESPYNEAEDGTYDHLDDKNARKQPAVDDTYNHASSVMSPDLSDYDVANNKQVHAENDDYDHTSPAENSYGHIDISPKQETDYSELY